MKFAIALIRHETNTFSPLPTELKDFCRGTGGLDGPVYGEAARLACENTNSAAAAYLDLAHELGAQAEFAVCANAVPSGIVTRDAFETLCDAVVNTVQGCDAVLLDLHGAMVAEGYPDAEGELLRRVREAIPPSVPVGVALDFHANFSPALIKHASVIAGYCTYPHIDVYETGARVGRSIVKMLHAEAAPVLLWRRLPMLTHMLRQTPLQQPMQDIMARAMQAEADGLVLNASVFGGFPLSDIPHAGLSIVIVADEGKTAEARALLDELAEMAWERREQFIFPVEPVQASIARAKALEEGPVLLIDHGDNCGAGGITDVMDVLEEVLRQGLEDVVAGPFRDPETVDALFRAGIGAQVTVQVGGRTDMPALGLKGRPLTLSGTVHTLTDGNYVVTGPMFTGMKLCLGRTAVLKVGSVLVFISERAQEPYDTGVFTHAGVDPAACKYVLLKSRQHFRAGFGPFARHVVLVSGPGVCSSDYSLFPFQHLARPIYPLDAETTPDDGESLVSPSGVQTTAE
ncbi:ABC transporter substrate-binding protein [Pusillimonas sp. TS35]|uniref:M81 family metallopeptidase n=1 Tax=Paracandidimonas lactea TaxID=2895524 RepID=UPI00136D9CDF|nr:M81 family metallopeptidase [Paracandidimonas lactea]MYN11817.1 ABC transporter substrate-binding protein [Pusillimonas sp. TS35]